MAEYQISVCHEIEARLKAKCDKLADAFIDDIGNLMHHTPLFLSSVEIFYCFNETWCFFVIY